MSNHVYDLRDTEGDRWSIQPGDPAHAACDLLAKQGWDIRLPARVLATGRARPDDVTEAEARLRIAVEAAEDDDPDLRELTDSLLLDRFATARQLAVLLANVQ